MTQLKIAVIGGGPTGLCAAKHAIEYKCDVTVFEQTSQIGGTWVYTDRIGTDENGLPIHTSMYNGLMTNVPVETMGFPDFPFPKKGKSFEPRGEVLAFFQSYAREFKVNEVVKLQHEVIRVRPVDDTRWELLVKNLKENTFALDIFDAVFVCNGHYSVPFYPVIEGFDNFKGRSMHSRDYRRPETFKDEDVLVIGVGPSGRDITYEIAKFAKRITLSHHQEPLVHNFGGNVSQRSDVQRFTENGAEFTDGSTETFTAVLFCTGYQFSFPFLSTDAGLCLEDGFYISPLFKHSININRPTMAIIGLQICAYTFMYDLQVRLCLKYWSGEMKTPSKAEMLEDTKQEMDKQIAKGNKKRHFHFQGVDQNDYFRKLIELLNFDGFPGVILKIFDDCNDLRKSNPDDYRRFLYTIVDDQTFTRAKLNENE